MARKYTSVADQCARIDAQRVNEDVPESEGCRVCIHAPTTAFGMIYPRTVSVDFDEGRWPSWFKPFVSWNEVEPSPVWPNEGWIAVGEVRELSKAIRALPGGAGAT